MKASIENGKITIPKEVIYKANLPLNGECEVEVVGTEIKITPFVAHPEKMIKILRESQVVAPIDEMVRNEVVDVD